MTVEVLHQLRSKGIPSTSSGQAARSPAFDATLTNNVLADNRAGTIASGLYIGSSSPRLLHTTIAHNTAMDGGDGSGLYITQISGLPPSAVALTNTILVSHTLSINVTAGNTVTLEATLWGTGAWTNTVDWGGGGTIITGTLARNYWGDPKFGTDYHIRPHSAAADAGVNVGVRDDIGSEPRPAGNGYDIGADELYAVTNTRSIESGLLHTFGDTEVGLAFSSPEDKGALNVVTVTLVFTYPTANHSGLPRWYNIEGNVSSGFTVTLSVPYDDADLTAAGIPAAAEGNLKVYHYNEGNRMWDMYPSTANTFTSIISTSVTGFSIWAIGTESNAPTNVGLRSFRAVEGNLGRLGVLVGIGLCFTGAWWAFRRRRG